MKKEKIHNKLIRDNIPKILEQKNILCITKMLNNHEFSNELNNKLQEEVQEYLDATSISNKIEELADILEVIYTILKSNNLSFEKLEKIRSKKYIQNGGFKNKIFLEKTIKNN